MIWIYVKNVCGKVVNVWPRKATLNAPLLYQLFKSNPFVNVIKHFHETGTGLPVYSYAPPGTVRDSKRVAASSFEIEGHGVFLMEG